MKTALIAKKMKKRSARSGAFRIRRTGASAFFAMLFPLPHCLAILKLGGPGHFSEKILEFYKYLCLLARIALETTGSAVITFSPVEIARLLGVSPTTVKNWIRYLVDNGVLVAINRKGGRGKKAQFLLRTKSSQQVSVPPNPGTTTFRTPPPERTRSAHNPQRKHRRNVKKKKSSEKKPPDPRAKGTDTPPKSSAAEDRAKKLKKLPNSALVIGKILDWVMEQVRLRCWSEGYSRRESDILCNAFGRQIKGKTLGQARKLATSFFIKARFVLHKLREAGRKGIRAVYATLGFIFRKLLGILRPRPKRKPKPASPQWQWDLNDPKQRKAFLKLVEKIVKQGGGTCPRCGQMIRVRYWDQDAGLAFQDKDGCRCLYIAFDRDAREREQRDKLDHQVLRVPEAERRPSGGPASLGEVLGDLIGVRTGAGVLPLPP